MVSAPLECGSAAIRAFSIGRNRLGDVVVDLAAIAAGRTRGEAGDQRLGVDLHLDHGVQPVSYTNTRAHQTGSNSVRRPLLEKKKKNYTI